MARVFILVEGYVKDEGGSVQATVTLVQDGNTNIIVDPGMTRDPGAISKTLSKHNLKPDSIEYVFTTHHHPDHTRHMGLFPKAKVIDFWALYDKDQWIDTGGEYQLTPNARVIPTPGHTEEDATLLVTNVTNVKTNKDVTVAICHLWWHKNKKDDPLAWNKSKLYSSRSKVIKLADYIIPGHGVMFKI